MNRYRAIGLAVLAIGIAGAEIRPSPAERAIARAEKTIAAHPESAEPYDDLAFALARRARETADTSFYDRAEEAIQKSLALDPNNFAGQKARVWVLLGRHEFAEALDAAKKLNRQAPDDVLVYGFLADAHAELGNYKAAEEAVQWMLDLRPGNVAALTRAAYLRELFGYTDGAIEFLSSAYQRTRPTEVEDQAWILTQIGHLYLQTGKLEAAERVLDQALGLFPGYHYGFAHMAKVRTAQQQHEKAAELLRQRYEAAPHPENLYDLAAALERAGRRKEADRAYGEFERKARAEMAGADNSNRELIFYYLGQGRRPAEALNTARREIGRRHDVYTLDAYAWVLYANGRYAEAREQIEKALAVGVKDANVFYHAGMIAARLKDRPAAIGFLEKSLQLNPHSESAAEARKALSRLRPS